MPPTINSPTEPPHSSGKLRHRYGIPYLCLVFILSVGFSVLFRNAVDFTESACYNGCENTLLPSFVLLYIFSEKGLVIMNLNDKKINFLGDSITAGSCTSGKGYIYCDLIGEAYHATVRNYGIGGTRIARQLSNEGPVGADGNFCDRAKTMDRDADVVVVFGGTNDFGHGDAPLGHPDDRTYDTFTGACHQLFSFLLDTYPTAVIVVLTPLHRANENNPRGDCKPTDVGRLSDYARILRSVAEQYALPVLDLYAQGGIQPCNTAQREALCPDGLHPNDAGHRLIARKLGAFLESL